MGRRTYRTAKSGQVYASEWPEWHVDCAEPGCKAHVTIAALGEAFTIKEAEKEAKGNKDCEGWKKIRGLWYCPAHTDHA